MRETLKFLSFIPQEFYFMKISQYNVIVVFNGGSVPCLLLYPVVEVLIKQPCSFCISYCIF